MSIEVCAKNRIEARLDSVVRPLKGRENRLCVCPLGMSDDNLRKCYSIAFKFSGYLHVWTRGLFFGKLIETSLPTRECGWKFNFSFNCSYIVYCWNSWLVLGVRVSTDLENLDKSGKFLFLAMSGNFVKLYQKSGNFSGSNIKKY